MKMSSSFLLPAALFSAALFTTACSRKAPVDLEAEKHSTKAPPMVAQPVEQPHVLTGEELCKRDLKRHVTFKDLDSVRIESIAEAEQRTTKLKIVNDQVIEEPDPNPLKPDPAFPVYNMQINAKNSFGGYTGPKPCSCHADIQGQRILEVICAN